MGEFFLVWRITWVLGFVVLDLQVENSTEWSEFVDLAWFPGGVFETKRMNNSIPQFTSSSEEAYFPWSRIWREAVPSKVSAFSWKALRNRIPSRENLCKRGVVFSTDSILCPCCASMVETSSHLLITHPRSLLVWEAVCYWLGKQLIFANSIREHFLEFMGPNSKGTKKNIMCLICQCTIWKIWKMRNNIVFKEDAYNLDVLIDGIKFSAWKWIHSHFPLSFIASEAFWEFHPLEIIPSKL